MEMELEVEFTNHHNPALSATSSREQNRQKGLPAETFDNLEIRTSYQLGEISGSVNAVSSAIPVGYWLLSNSVLSDNQFLHLRMIGLDELAFQHGGLGPPGHFPLHHLYQG